MENIIQLPFRQLSFKNLTTITPRHWLIIFICSPTSPLPDLRDHYSPRHPNRSQQSIAFGLSYSILSQVSVTVTRSFCYCFFSFFKTCPVPFLLWIPGPSLLVVMLLPRSPESVQVYSCRQHLRSNPTSLIPFCSWTTKHTVKHGGHRILHAP